MALTFITIKEASELSGKSAQTIRRAIISKKIKSRKKKTPQGYNYAVDLDSLLKFYSIESETAKTNSTRKQRALSKKTEYATVSDLKNIRSEINDLLKEQEKTKENFVNFMKTFQDKFILLENQLKLLEEPKNKRWYQFWK